MNNTTIVFCGLSKNNFKTLERNIEFIQSLKVNINDKKFHTIIVDSSSNDGSKEYLARLEHDIITIHKDDIDEVSKSRIERIAICRNLGLDYIKSNFENRNLIYIPCDMDLDLFSKTTVQEFNSYVDLVLSKISDGAIFPISVPNYYDIFALRAKGWVNFNSQLIVNFFKKYIRVGSFFWNYFFIFRYQWPPSKVRRKNYSITSAFGGIGIYNISNKDLSKCRYEISIKDKDLYSEHLFFNAHFNNLKIKHDWLIEAPIQHIEYKSYGFLDKIKYILRTIKYDFTNLFPKGFYGKK
tara:strand:- start:1495 stop:2382 length:888 start_codon:yes stop_codon:yes gene_type:complete